MIDADGVTIVAYDSNIGTRDPMDFEVDLRLPSGNPYEIPRTEKVRYPPKERDNSKRISCFIYVPRNASGPNKDEETAAEMRLEKVANSHFHKHGGVGVGFFRPRDPASGRRESILTMFVNHPQDVERGTFIRKAFRDFKWIDAGMGELIKVSLRAEDIAASGIKECCFKNECPTLQGRTGCTERETCLRKINMTRPNPKNEPEERTRKRKAVVIDAVPPPSRWQPARRAALQSWQRGTEWNAAPTRRDGA